MIESPGRSVLIFSLDPAIRDVLRWATGEVVEHVHVATSWAGAASMAATYRPAVAVIDLDGMPGNVRQTLLSALRDRFSVPIVVLGDRTALDEASKLGVETRLTKPVNVGALMGKVQHLAEQN
jgi:DNA-binding response OmpR family regulator